MGQCYGRHYLTTNTSVSMSMRNCAYAIVVEFELIFVILIVLYQPRGHNSLFAMYFWGYSFPVKILISLILNALKHFKSDNLFNIKNDTQLAVLYHLPYTRPLMVVSTS